MDERDRADLENLHRVQQGWRRVFSSRRKTLDAVRAAKRAALQSCARYLVVEAEERAAMREFFRRTPVTLPAGRSGVQSVLHGALRDALGQLRAAGTEDRLQLGLAAASLEDFQFDGRETLTGLGDLYRAAIEHGLAPRPAFALVAKLSSTEPGAGGGWSTAELIGRFEETAHFREDVAPTLTGPAG